MYRTLKLLFSANSEWEKMALNPPNAFIVLLFSILPLLALMLGVEAYGLMQLGENHGEIGRVKLPDARILTYVLFYGAASIVVIFAGAMLLKNVAASFNLQSSYGACFVLMAYGYSPVFLTRALDALPQVNTWVCWAIAALLAIRVLYHGVGHWLKPEQTKGLGVFLVTVIYTVVLSGLVHFASVQVLNGRFLRNVYSAHPENIPARSAERALTNSASVTNR